MELQAELTQKDHQLLSQAFTILDTMMAAHISEESVSAVAYLAQLNAILGEASVGVVMMVSNTSVAVVAVAVAAVVIRQFKRSYALA